jgi:hypothetical protein
VQGDWTAVDPKTGLPIGDKAPSAKPADSFADTDPAV